MQFCFRVFLLLLAAVLAPVRAASTGELGMPAPPLQIAQFVKGDAVDLASGKGKKIYVVEFWATWCAPCRESIPHLTELQQRFKNQGVVIIGVSDETAAEVKPFVASLGAKMDYVVALDRTNKTSEAYMDAFGIDGVPNAFLVDKSGVIAWQGRPSEGLDRALEEIVTGKYDLAGAIRTDKLERRKEQLMAEYFDLVTGDRDKPDPKAPEAGRKFITEASGDPKLLDGFAWTILTFNQVKFRDVPLAAQASKVAVDATKGENPGYLGTYARALFDSGKTAEAIKFQKKAIALTKDVHEKGEAEETLATYEKKAAP